MAKSEPSLLDDARALTPDKYRPKSAVEIVAEQMPAALRAEFAAAVGDPTVNAKGLAAALNRRGYEVSHQSISHFRRQGRTL